MTMWNLFVILCFGLLYLGLVFVHLQLRRLRDDIRLSVSPENFPKPDEAPPPPPLDVDALRADLQEDLREELSGLQNRLVSRVSSVESRLHGDMDLMQQQLEGIDARLEQGAVSKPPAGGGVGGGYASAGVSPSAVPEQPQDRDNYREAKLLLANGVEEEQVMQETGLSMEEVSLLNRLTSENKRG